MCGRFTLAVGGEELAEVFDLVEPPDTEGLGLRRYNVAPTDTVLAIRDLPDGRRALPMRWGLIPPRSSSIPRKGRPVINARSETAHTNGLFRGALRRRRCVVPADGFYEWKKLPEGRFPFRFCRPDRRPFGMAALYSEWVSPDGVVVPSTTVLTTTPNVVVSPLHDRMPVILDGSAIARWLDASITEPDALRELLKPAADDFLCGYPVSRLVNSVRNDVAACIEPGEHPEAPVADPPGQLSLLD